MSFQGLPLSLFCIGLHSARAAAGLTTAHVPPSTAQTAVQMPLPLIARVPSTSRSLFALDENSMSPPCSRPLPLIDGYTLTEHLGAGTSGSDVFMAHKGKDGSLVALKVLSRKHGVAACAVPRFIREADITCNLRHANLVKGIEWGETPDHLYLAMDLLRGQSLEALLLDRGRLEWRMATKLALDLAKALAHLQTQGVVHRDVKPSNVQVVIDSPRLVSDGAESGALHAVLIDLGLARRAMDENDNGDNEIPYEIACRDRPAAPSASMMRRVKTPAYSAIGSPAFMAPEQVRDARTASHAADAYGVGATWYAALTGTMPFNGASMQKVMQQVLSGELQPPSAHVRNMPPAVDAMIMWLLATDPHDRPPGGEALVSEIESVLRHPNDAARVQRAREVHARRALREANIEWCVRCAGMAVAVVVTAWMLLPFLWPED